jgi:hypothetical protein
MTSYTTQANYPYPAAADQLVDYPTTAAAFAGYLDNLPNRNRIINGLFDIWQRGSSFAAIATGTYTADRWVYTQTGAGGSRSVSQQSNALGTLIGGMQAKQFLRLDIATLGSATAQTIGQRIEDVRTFADETISISCMVKGTLTGAVTLNVLQNFGSGGSPSATVTTAVGTYTPTASWVRKTFTVAVPSISGKTLGSTADTHYLELQFDAGNKTGQLDIWGVQLEQNTTATILEREPVQQTLAKCQRYYWLQASGNGCNVGGFIAFNPTANYMVVVFPIPFRTTPVCTVASTFIGYYYNGGSSAVSPTGTATSSQNGLMQHTAAIGNAHSVFGNNASSSIVWAAEL